MASPQPDKFTKISNELLDALCVLHLSGNEWSYIHAIIRKTYGFNKKNDWIANSQIVEMTGMRKERVSEAKRSLIEKNVITENRNKVGLQKDYERWHELRKTVTIVTENRNKQLRKTVPTKDNKDKRHKSERSSHDDMGWNKQSDNYDEERVVDLETGEVVSPLEEKKLKDKQQREAIKKNLLLIEQPRGLKYNPKALNSDIATYQQLILAGWSDERIVNEYLDLIGSEYWQNERKRGNFPGMNTVQFSLRNKQPK